MRSHSRLPITLALAAATVVFVAAPAAAHTTVSPSEAAADSFARLTFRVPHGCEGAATERLDVQIPEGVVSVKPEMVPGWDATTEIGPYDEPVELHGEEITEGVKVVTWTAQEGNALPDDLFREFGLSVKLPPEAGETLWFPAVQTCEDGSEAAWIQIPEEGEDPHALDSPAPGVTLIEAAGQGGHESDGASGADSDAADDSLAVAAPALAGDGGAGGLVIAALAVGGLGMLLGGAGIVAARRR